MGKGSRRRQEDAQKIEANWDQIFAPKPQPEPPPQQESGEEEDEVEPP